MAPSSVGFGAAFFVPNSRFIFMTTEVCEEVEWQSRSVYLEAVEGDFTGARARLSLLW
jgi:hypothetical protein